MNPTLKRALIALRLRKPDPAPKPSAPKWIDGVADTWHSRGRIAPKVDQRFQRVALSLNDPTPTQIHCGPDLYQAASAPDVYQSVADGGFDGPSCSENE